LSDEKEIREVMHDDLRAAKGKPPIYTTTAEQRARVRAAMLAAIQNDDEGDYINCVLDLGHEQGSAEYKRMMRVWTQRPASLRKRKK
jgi:hypothetical protein